VRGTGAGALTDVPGILVGHWTDLEAGTGCTVVLCEPDAVGGVDVRGAAPGTRETDLLRPGTLVERVHAVVLAGGSAFGLDAAAGVMRFLEERGRGFRTGVGPVPIVPAAVLYDLGVGRPDRRPDAAAGYAACLTAGATVAEGSVGAGTGATVAKLRGLAHAVKGGVGSASRLLADGTVVGALVVANALGNVVDPDTGAVVAGAPPAARAEALAARDRVVPPTIGMNTVLGVVATTAVLDPAAANRLATIAHDGLARALRPSHTHYDGDAIFALSLPTPAGLLPDMLALGAAAVDLVAEATVRAARAARGLHGVPGLADST
jgi:L-aminopeptidase/D-esterase-like protein